MFDSIIAAIMRQIVLCENQVRAFDGIAIRKTVANKDRRRVLWIQQTHHRRFAGGTSVRARLTKERKFSAPRPRAQVEMACADTFYCRALAIHAARQNAGDAVVKAVTDDVGGNVAR